MSNQETFVYRAKINSMKRHQMQLRKYCLIMSVLFILSMTSFLVSTKMYMDNKETLKEVTLAYENLKEEYEDVQAIYVAMYNEYSDMVEYTEECEDTIGKMYSTMEEMQDENESLVESNNTYYTEIQEYEKRSELFDKYEYCLYRTDGVRTDITFDQLTTMETAAKEKGIDPDLVMSIVMVESEGKEKCTNSASTARGYGQFLKGTGKFTYEKLMGAGSYSHDYALNGSTNLKMMVSYLDYLVDNSGGSVYGAIKKYRGPVSQATLNGYYNKINKYLAKADKSLSTIK